MSMFLAMLCTFPSSSNVAKYFLPSLSLSFVIALGRNINYIMHPFLIAVTLVQSWILSTNNILSSKAFPFLVVIKLLEGTQNFFSDKERYMPHNVFL